MWPFRRTPELLDQLREEVDRSRPAASGQPKPRSDEPTQVGDEQQTHDGKPAKEFRDLFEHFEEHPEGSTTRRWSVSGSIGPDSHIEALVQRKPTADSDVHETTFSGTPGQLLTKLARHLLGSLIPRRRPR